MNDSLLQQQQLSNVHHYGKYNIKRYGKDNTLQYKFMTGELLLLLKGRSRSYVSCKALCPFQTKTCRYEQDMWTIF